MTNEADKLLTPAQMALTRLIKWFDFRGSPVERDAREADIKLVVAAISSPDLCKHRLQAIGASISEVECVDCGSRWFKRINTETWLPFDPAICECCGQKKPTT